MKLLLKAYKIVDDPYAICPYCKAHASARLHGADFQPYKDYYAGSSSVESVKAYTCGCGGSWHAISKKGAK